MGAHAKAAHRLFLHLSQPKMSYKDGYQKSYFVAESFEDAAFKIRALAASIRGSS
jgi:hypothetical protein